VAQGALTRGAYTGQQGASGFEVALTIHGGEDPLAGRRVVAVVLRVVLDTHGLVLHGEVVDTATRTTERFAGWEGLVATVRRCLGRSAAVKPPEGTLP
jgi:hypothetical protein